MPKYQDLQPLPEAYLVAADLRRQAKELLLMAQRLEASCDIPASSGNFEFIFSKKKNDSNKPKSPKRMGTIPATRSTKGEDTP